MSSSFHFPHLRLASLIAVFVLAAGLFGATPLRAQLVDFEDGTIPSDWTEPSGSDAPWTITSATSSSGTYSLGSSDISDDETAEVEVTVDVPKDSVITFDYRVSSESCCDELRFYIDGVQQLEDAGDTGWQSSGAISVSAGTHTLRWAYEKDLSVSDLSDKAWIDNVALPTIGPPSGVLAQAASVGDVQLDWVSAGGGKYRIYRDTAPIDSSAGPSSYTPLDSVSAGTTTYTDGSTTSGTTYYYRITTVEGGSETGFSRQVAVVPGFAATAAQPRSGIPGSSIRIYGKGFDPTASNNTVSFEAASATVTAAQPSALTVEVPSSDSVTVPVTVGAGGEQDTVGTRFQILAPNSGTRAFVSNSLAGVSQSDAAWGDFDADGDQDLIVAGGGTATLYQKDGSEEDGSFTSPSVGLTGVSNGAAVAWGDYDNDEELELVIAGGLTTTIYQWESDGSDTFQSFTSGLEGVDLAAAAWGDFENDGDLDLLVSGQNSSGNPSTTLYRNDGNDTFTAVSAGLPDLQNGSVAWGDYNGDGLQDVAMSGVDDGGSSVTQIYRNQGDSTFTPVGAGLTGVNAGAVRWVDYDTDSDLDLLVTGADGSANPQTILYRNDGEGTFVAVGANLADLSGSDADWGDYDGDGDPDLMLTGETATDTTALLYRNDGMGDFAVVDTTLTGVTNGSVDWADQNGDGVLDLAITGTDESNTASAHIYESTSAPPPPPSNVVATAFADSLQLSWEAVGASDLAEYRIYRSTSAIDSLNYASATPLDTVAAGTTTYSDAAVTTGTQYYYRVTAADAGTESGASNEASGTPEFRVAGFVPVQGTPTSAVRVFGSGFSPTANTVSFIDTTGADLSATITRTQGTALTVEVPNGLGAPARIAVERSDGATDTTTARFTPVGGGIGDRSFAAVSLGLPDLQEADLAWGDYDEDGDLDVAVNGIDGTVNVTSIYRNDGNGTFTALNAGLTDVAIGSVDWADYDRDGDLDLLVTGRDGSANPQTILYRNDGGGNFTEVTAGLADVSASDAAWGDFNGDGYRDLVLAGNDGAGRTTVLYRNNGDGTFTSVDAGLTGVEGPGIDWADYDGDGALDLLVAGRSDAGPSATIYHNDGGGQFSVAGANLTGVSTGGTSVEAGVGAEWGDYDADGDPDLVVTGLADDGTEVTAIYRNDGGTFTKIDAGLTGVQLGDAAWGDYDGDGDLDLVVTGRDADFNARTILYRNEGNDSFVARDAGLTGMTFSTVAWGDYDGDGALDPVTLGRDGNDNPLTAAYQSQPEPYPPSGLELTARSDSIELDWTGVKASDLGEYRVYRSTAPIDSAAGPGNTSATQIANVGSGITQYTDTGVALGDTLHYRVTAVDTASNEGGFSNQAVGTLVYRVTGLDPTSGVPGSSVRVYSSGFDPTATNNTVEFIDSTGTTTAGTPLSTQGTALTVAVPSGLVGPVRIAVGRSDGRRDTTAVRFTPIETGIGDRSFAPVTTSIPNLNNSSLDWGDYDQDGDLDLLVSGEDVETPTTRIYRNDGNGTFTDIGAPLSADFGEGAVEWGDYDSDGDLDFVVLTGQETLVYRNDGNGNFQNINAGLVGVNNGDADWGDFDGDGDQDLVVTGVTGGTPVLRIYRNDGSGTFTELGVGLSGLELGSADWGDYDQDGDLDLVVTGQDDSENASTTIYRNDGGGTFTSIGAGVVGVRRGDADWGDYDQDGDLDLVVAGNSDGSVPDTTEVYRNDGGGSFTPVGTGLSDAFTFDESVSWGDYDGNGTLDLAVGGSIYRNDGGGTFVQLDAGLPAYSVSAWGDYDADGTLDLAGFGGAGAVLHESRAAPAAPDFLVGRPLEGKQLRIGWPATSAGDASKYRIYRSTASITGTPSDLTPYDSAGIGTTTYLDSSVTANTTYYYRVTVVDTTQAESKFSSESALKPKPVTGTLYVDPTASGANSGASWNDAYPHLQSAMDSVNANPLTDYEIRVAEGVYYPDEGPRPADDTTTTFRIAVDDVSLLGGYPAGGGTETERDPENNLTVLSGDVTQDDADPDGDGVIASPDDIAGANANTVLYLDGNTYQQDRERIQSNTLISGVTITGGQARGSYGGSGGDGGDVTPGNEVSPQEGGVQVGGEAIRAGGGVVCVNQPSPLRVSSCSPVFRDVTIRGNQAINGGGLAAVGYSETNPSFRNVSFVANRADSLGGAAVITTRSAQVDTVTTAGIANPHFVRTTFQDNRSRAGAAVALDVRKEGRANAQFVSTAFRDNRAGQRGGAVLLAGAANGQMTADFTNALFYRNQAGDEGGGVFAIGKTGGTVAPTFTNATFVANRAAVVGGALYSDGRGGTVTPKLANAILWANEAGAGGRQVASNDAPPAFRHSLIDGSGGSSNWTSGLGTDEGGNIDADPLLVDTSATDFRPQEDSPVLDAGLNGALPADTTDLDADGDSTETLPWGLADSTRVTDANGDGTATVNMGAYEAVGPDLTPLAAPGTVAITAFTDSLRVGWTAVTDGDLTKYRIYRDTVAIDSAAGPGSYVPYDSVGAGTTVLPDTAVAADSTYHYRVTSVDNAGNESSFSGEVQAQPAAALTVWPGDTDNDGVVNQNDVLPLGFQWGQTGPARDSTGCAFEGRAAAAWPTQAATYADANGDGVVDQGDVLCIGLNWGDSTSTSKSMPLYAGSSTAKTSLTAPNSSDGHPQEPRDRGQEASRRVLTTPSGQTLQTDDAPGAKKASETGRLVLDAPAEPDSVLWVTIRAQDLTSAGGAAFEVAYPASKATVEAVEMSDWFGEGALTQSHVDETAGVVGIGLVNADSVRSGSGVLARLKVRLSESTTDPVQLQLREARVGRTGRIASLEAGDGIQVRRVPETFKLYGNYPNPIRKRTTIRYDLPSERHVKLRVYDVLGRHVATLVDETQKAGQKTVTWQAAEMASGVYVYRLTAGDRSDTGKMTVVR